MKTTSSNELDNVGKKLKIPKIELNNIKKFRKHLKGYYFLAFLLAADIFWDSSSVTHMWM